VFDIKNERVRCVEGSGKVFAVQAMKSCRKSGVTAPLILNFSNRLVSLTLRRFTPAEEPPLLIERTSRWVSEAV
jgi:hypothetical protein